MSVIWVTLPLDPINKLLTICRMTCQPEKNTCCKKHPNIGLITYEDTHFAEAMVLSCIDYRFVDTTIFTLERDPILSQKYDFSTLAGASLGFNQDTFPHWKNTFIDLVKLAIELHHIKQLIVFDHMDCGAYQLLYPNIQLRTDDERQLHIKNIKQFIYNMKKIFPKLIYSGYLIHVDNSVEPIVRE